MPPDSNDIFTEPPEGLGEEEFHFGAFVAGMGSMDGLEVARAYAEAADRLLATAAERRESWEMAPPSCIATGMRWSCT